jgi:formiminotetrahydrofolate cyclodeaminase
MYPSLTAGCSCSLVAQACQQAGQHAQQVAFENAALRKQLNLLWNNQVRPGHAQGSPCP